MCFYEIEVVLYTSSEELMAKWVSQLSTDCVGGLGGWIIFALTQVCHFASVEVSHSGCIRYA